MGKENSKYYYFGAVDGNLDYYLYMDQASRRSWRIYILNRKNSTTSALPWITNTGATPESELEIASEFRKNIPCD